MPFMLSFYGTCEDGTGGPGDAGGGGGSAPTGVSIATGASGNYDNSVILASTHLGSLNQDALTSNNGSTATGATAYEVIVEFGYNTDYEAMLNANLGTIGFYTRAYARHSGATSFQWDLSSLNVTNVTSGVLSSSSIGGTASTSQDATGTQGVGETVSLVHNSGGRGYLLMPAGDAVVWKVDLTATNSNGSTSAQQLEVGIEVT